jgi:hypothetical protein
MVVQIWGPSRRRCKAYGECGYTRPAIGSATGRVGASILLTGAAELASIADAAVHNARQRHPTFFDLDLYLVIWNFDVP